MVNVKQINKNIGKIVKNLRITKGITQEQLAEKVGLERKSITAIETGRTFISCEVLANLSNFFEVEPAVFFKSGFMEHTDENINLKREINRQLSNCDSAKLKTIYNILISLADNT